MKPFDTAANAGAERILTGGTVLNVYSGELLKMDVVIRGERFQYVGPLSSPVGEGAFLLDVAGKVLVPGYVEPHCHPWLLYNPLTFAQEASRLGTTSFFCDNLIFFSLMGVSAFEAFMDALQTMPVKFFWFCRAVPQTPQEGEEELFSVENVERLLRHPAAASLGEITRWQDLLAGDRRIIEMIEKARALGKRVDGHTAGAKYEKINGLSRLGVESCHESISAREVLDRLRLGLHVMLRESSLRPDLQNLLKPILENGLLPDRVMLTSDASCPAFYRDFGVTDHLLRIALREGVDPIVAYRMVTLHPAVYFGMDQDIGGIAPGRYADILVLEDLQNPVPEMVISRGRLLARKGKPCEPWPEVAWERFLPRSLFNTRTWRAERDHFMIPCNGEDVLFPTIKLLSAVITRTDWVSFPVRNGYLDLADREDFCFVALINREGTWVTNGILQGIGDKVEGLASSFNTATQVLVIGRDPSAMCVAVNRVLDLKGGIVCIEKGKIAYELPLPLGGMMSQAPMAKLAEKEDGFKKFLFSRDYPFHDPLYTLVFLPNDFLPDTRINYKGVVNIREKKILWKRRDLGRSLNPDSRQSPNPAIMPSG